MSDRENYHGYTIEYDQDHEPENPREMDNVTTMVCFHRSYNLGDDDHGYKQSDFNSWDELRKRIQRDHKPVYLKALYLYDHSGITISTGDFRHVDPGGWDSGVVGFVFVSAKKAREEWGRLTKKWRAAMERVADCEVNTYDQYLTNDVWCYSITDPDGEDVDSLSGCFGWDYVREEARRAADFDRSKRATKQMIVEASGL